MKAVVFHGIAIVRITTSAICGTDLHFVNGIGGQMKKGTILGHEAVGGHGRNWQKC